MQQFLNKKKIGLMLKKGIYRSHKNQILNLNFFKQQKFLSCRQWLYTTWPHLNPFTRLYNSSLKSLFLNK